MQLARAAVADRGQILHLAGILFADVAQVQAQNGVGLDPAACHGRQTGRQFGFQPRRLQVARQPVLGLDQRNLFLQAARDVAQLDILTGLDAEQHLRNKLL